MVVLVTGASSGFGRLACIEAKRRGYIVYAGLRDVSNAPEGVHALRLDVTSAEDRRDAVRQILDTHGRIDALVNNAGQTLGGFLELVDEDELRSLLEVNVMGVFELTKCVLPAMRAQRSGAIVMVSSMSGRMAAPGLGAYAASKFALEGMSEAWRHELAPFGVHVSLVEPGPYRTDMLGKNRTLARRATEPGPYAELTARMDALARRAERGAGDPDVVARRIVDLCGAGRPALRHPMGGSAKIRTLLLRFAPFALWELIFRRTLRG